MFVNTDRPFRFRVHFAIGGIYCVEYGVWFCYLEANVNVSAILSTARSFVRGRMSRWAFVPFSFGLWDLGINGGPTL